MTTLLISFILILTGLLVVLATGWTATIVIGYVMRLYDARKARHRRKEIDWLLEPEQLKPMS